MTDIKLPEWAAQDETGAISIDPAIAYPHYIGQLGLKADKYGAEVARRCAIADLKALLGVPLRIKILKRTDWALAKLTGTDEDAKRGNDEFRQHYDKMNQRSAAQHRAAQFMAAGDL